MMQNNMPYTQVITQVVYAPPSEWQNSLCGCCDDCGSCIVSFIFPCVQYGQNRALLTNGSCVGDCICYALLAPFALSWCLGCSERAQVRAKYNIIGGQCDDCCAHFFCTPCALAQEYREMNQRGG